MLGLQRFWKDVSICDGLFQLVECYLAEVMMIMCVQVQIFALFLFLLYLLHFNTFYFTKVHFLEYRNLLQGYSQQDAKHPVSNLLLIFAVPTHLLIQYCEKDQLSAIILLQIKQKLFFYRNGFNSELAQDDETIIFPEIVVFRLTVLLYQVLWNWIHHHNH